MQLAVAVQDCLLGEAAGLALGGVGSTRLHLGCVRLRLSRVGLRSMTSLLNASLKSQIADVASVDFRTFVFFYWLSALGGGDGGALAEDDGRSLGDNLVDRARWFRCGNLR